MPSVVPCPDLEQFRRLVEGQLSAEDMERLTRHLENCDRCAETVRALKAQDTLVEMLQAARDPDTDESEEPVVQGLIARLEALPSGGRGEGLRSGNVEASGSGQPSITPEELSRLLAPPQGPDEIGRLGTYRVLHVCGVGGMGVVFQAEDVQLRRPVALKLMMPALAANPDARQRFLREARATAAIEHDHIVLYRMSTGVLPFRGSSAIAIVTAAAQQQPKPPHKINPDLPPSLSHLIFKLLAKKADERPESARAVIELMDAVKHGHGISTFAPPTLSSRILRWPMIAAGIAAGLLIAAAIYFFTFNGTRSPVASVGGPNIVESEASSSEPDRSKDLTHPAFHEIRVLRGHKDTVNSATFSPNGLHVLSGGYDKTVRLWSVQSGEEIGRFGGHTGRVYSMAFSQDGCWAVSGGFDDRTIRIWDVDSGREVRRFGGHSGKVTCVAISADGRHVLSASGGGFKDGRYVEGTDQTIRLWDVQSESEIRSFPGHAGSVR